MNNKKLCTHFWFQVCFLPFLSTDDIAQLLLNGEINMNVIVREYFLVSSAENFILPKALHPYCEEPKSYNLSSRDLQIFLYFNRMRYIQSTGMRYSKIQSNSVKLEPITMYIIATSNFTRGNSTMIPLFRVFMYQQYENSWNEWMNHPV